MAARPKKRTSRRPTRRRSGAGEGVDDKALASAKAWIIRLRSMAQDALHELETKGGPGMKMSYFVGHMKDYRAEDWYERYYR